MRKKRVGILGSAFDPPHYAHAAMAILALEAGVVDEVWLCPSPNRWDKTPVANLDTRLAWSEKFAAILREKKYPVEVCKDELSFETYRGSYVFLTHLTKHYCDITFFPIVGLDSWQSISLWRDPVSATRNGELVLREFSFLVFPRQEAATASISQPHVLMPQLSKALPYLETSLTANELESLSSSFVRKSLAQNLPNAFVFEILETKIRQSEIYRTSI
jgi:nicotinate-nucleotide adenylyltransferase